MTQQSTPPVYPFHYLQVQPVADDEIDLLEVLRRIWAGRYQILSITLAFIFLAGVYAFTAKQVWTSKAIMVQPRVEDLASYYQVTQRLKRIVGNSIDGLIEIDAAKIADQVFSELTTQADSADLRREFWEQSDYFAKNAAEEKSELSKAKMLDDLINKSILLIPAADSGNKYTSLALSANEPKMAKNLLGQFVEHLNAHIWAGKISELQAAIENITADLQQEKKSIELNTLAAQKLQLESARNALNEATQAGIKNVNIAGIRSSEGSASTDSGDMLFLLGTNALNAKVSNLTTKAPSLPVRYFEIERQLKELAALPKPGKDMRSYRYLSTPDTPLTKDKPKRALILIVGGILGMLFGISWTMIAGVFRHKSLRTEISSSVQQ